MKKILLSIFAIFPLMASAQVAKSYDFHFENPALLNPAITPSSENGGEVNVTDTKFYSDDNAVNISFKYDANYLGARIVTEYGINGLEPNLRLYRGAEMIVASTPGQKNGIAELDSFKISENSIIANLKLLKPTNVGEVNYREEWFGHGVRGVDSLIYRNEGQVPAYRTLTVYYHFPSDILEPLTAGIKPAPGSEVSKISKITLSYDKRVRLNNDASFVLTKKDDSAKMYIFNAVADGHDIILTLDEPVTELGDYTLTIAEKSIRDDEGYYNKKATYGYTVVEPQNTLELVEVSPAPGVVDKISSGIKLTFNNLVGGINIDPSLRVAIAKRDGEVVRYATLEKDDSDDYTVIATFTNVVTDITDEDIYTVTVPEKLVFNIAFNREVEDLGVSAGAKYNPEFKFKYNVGNLQFPSEAVLDSAKVVLAFKGVGYPKEDAVARKALAALIETGMGDDSKYEEAIANFYAETDVQLPSDDAYIVSLVGDSGNGTLFLTYDSEEEAVTLTDLSANATAFIVEPHDNGTVSLKTADGHYLHQLQPSYNYTGTSPKNVTAEYNSDVNDLTFSRFPVTDEFAAEKTFGLMRLYGSLGTNMGGEEQSAYTLVNLERALVLTDAAAGENVYFSNTLTNAVRLTEVEIPVPDAVYKLSPESATQFKNLRRIEVSFPEIDVVTLSADAIVTLIGDHGTIYPATEIVAVGGQTNVFAILFDELANDSYKLVIPKGTFAYELEGRQVPVQEITARYTQDAGDFIYDFFDRYTTGYLEAVPQDYYIKDVDLNKFTLYVATTSELGVSDKNVYLREYWTQALYATAHFERVKDFEIQGHQAIRLVWDNPIKEGSLEAGKYVYVIERATFGDYNYAQYLADPNSIDRSSCHVNEYLNYVMDVDNNKATLITRMTGDHQISGIIYDLTGRRVQGTLKPGIYVANGHKVFMK